MKKPVVCSAGNGGQDLEQSPRYPASYDLPFVISVASTGRTDELTTTSNWSAMHVAVAAPGEELLTTKAGGGYKTFSGTSAAAAIASGVAGLVKTLRPRLSASRTQQIILGGARKVPAREDTVMSGGVVNAAGALACLEDAVIKRESFGIFLKAWLSFRPLRAEPRFRSLLGQVGLD